MKTFKLYLLGLFILGSFSCTKDDDSLNPENQPSDQQDVVVNLELTAPLDGEDLVLVRTTLQWQAIDAEDEVSYEVALGTSRENLVVVARDLPNASYQFGVGDLENLNTATAYYWKVLARSGSRILAESDIRSFNTEVINPTVLLLHAPYTARRAAAVSTFHDKIWVIGGRNQMNETLNDIWSSSDGENWVQEGYLPTGIYAHELIAFDDKFWIFGGINEDGFINQKIFYSEDGINWTEAMAADMTLRMPFKQYSAAEMIVHENRLFRLGGYNGGVGDTSDERYIYSSSNGFDWILESENNGFKNKYSFSTVNFNGKLYGAERDSDDNTFVLRESTDAIHWQEVRRYRNLEMFGELFTMNSKLISFPTTYEDVNIEIKVSEDAITWKRATNQTVEMGTKNYEFVNLGGTFYAIGGVGSFFRDEISNAIYTLN